MLGQILTHGCRRHTGLGRCCTHLVLPCRPHAAQSPEAKDFGKGPDHDPRSLPIEFLAPAEALYATMCCQSLFAFHYFTHCVECFQVLQYKTIDSDSYPKISIQYSTHPTTSVVNISRYVECFQFTWFLILMFLLKVSSIVGSYESTNWPWDTWIKMEVLKVHGRYQCVGISVLI